MTLDEGNGRSLNSSRPMFGQIAQCHLTFNQLSPERPGHSLHSYCSLRRATKLCLLTTRSISSDVRRRHCYTALQIYYDRPQNLAGVKLCSTDNIYRCAAVRNSTRSRIQAATKQQQNNASVCYSCPFHVYPAALLV